MEWILGGMVYEDSCGRAWPCIGGEFHDFFYRPGASIGSTWE